MRLRVSGVPVDGGPERGSAEVAAGQEAVLRVADPAALLLAAAGAPPMPARSPRRDARGWERLEVGARWDEVAVQLDGRSLAGMSPAERGRCGLAVSAARLPEGAELSVLDVVLLGWQPVRSVRALAVAVGARRARAALADAEAAGRALAGRLGLAGWLEHDAGAAPPEVQALADLTRVLLPGPTAVVARWPAWLGAAQAQELADVVGEEAARLAAAWLWVAAHGDTGLGR